MPHSCQVDVRLKQLENNQMDVMMRLQNLLVEVEALRNKTDQNREMAQDAKAQADNATQLASSLEEVSFCCVWMIVSRMNQSTHCRLHRDILKSNYQCCFPELQRHRETLPWAAGEGGVSWRGIWGSEQHQPEGKGYPEGGRVPPREGQERDRTTWEWVH